MTVRPAGTGVSACPQCSREEMMSAAFPGAELCTACAAVAWSQREPRYAASAYAGSGDPGTQRYLCGRDDVLITAPNSVNYHRGNYQHKAARWTGSAAEALALATGFSALAMSGPPRQVPYRDNPEYAFADRLRQLVAADTFVLDIIGMRDRQIDVCLGTGPLPDRRCEALAARIAHGFTGRGIRVSMNAPFPALAPVTVTAFTQVHLGASALQVGLSAWLRDPDGSPTMAKIVLDVLRGALAEVA